MKASPAETGLTTSAFPDPVSTTVTAPLLLVKLPKTYAITTINTPTITFSVCISCTQTTLLLHYKHYYC